MANNLKNETSPYLLQHKDNPVNWYPWGDIAFEKAKEEDKPIFLSIGYSTCHWCHVMAHESFEDVKTAEILNKNFVSIKVDKEERPDIDCIYMKVCQAMTGAGGWPMSIFMTPEQIPFFAGTYFSQSALQTLLYRISKLWLNNRSGIALSANEIKQFLNASEKGNKLPENLENLIHKAYFQLEQSYDEEYGGFGNEPKFPMPHSLIFLMDYFKQNNNKKAAGMAEHTLSQMYRGGIFDHVGGGFSRYSTDRCFLVPHFEKMLYDNALLIMSYTKAFTITKKEIYKTAAQKTAEYIMREMTCSEGGFYSAQDADSEGEEGKYYTFSYREIIDLLGKEDAEKFNEYFGVSIKGNFNGKNILNLLHTTYNSKDVNHLISKLYEYRKSRMTLQLDDKILTAWNGLMIAAFSMLYKAVGETKYLSAAENAYNFIENNLCDRDVLYVSFRSGKHGTKGFLDDYAFYIFGLIKLYGVSFDEKYLKRAKNLCKKAIESFFDNENGGFYMYGNESEQLISRPKETYDGAIPSGNSVMAYNMIWLSLITGEELYPDTIKRHFEFMSANAQDYPMGHCFFLLALSAYLFQPLHIVCALKDSHTDFPEDAAVMVIDGGNEKYPLLNNRTTYYICKNNTCLPPTNDINAVL